MQKSFLIFEKSLAVRNYFKIFLKAHNYNIYTSDNIKNLFDLLAEYKDIDIIILNQNQLNLNDENLINTIRNIEGYKLVHIILFTSIQPGSNLLKNLRIYDDTYISKPFYSHKIQYSITKFV